MRRVVLCGGREYYAAEAHPSIAGLVSGRIRER